MAFGGEEGEDAGLGIGVEAADADDGFIGDLEQVLKAALTEFAALVKDGDAVGDFLDLLEEMGGEDDGFSLAFEEEHEVADLAGAEGVNAGGGFVEEEEVGVVEEGLGQADALEHAFGVGAEASVSSGAEIDEIEELLDAGGEAWAGHAGEAAVVVEDFASGEEVGEIRVFREEAEAVAGGHGAGGVAEDGGGAAGGGGKAEEEFHGGAFAGAVGAEEAEDLAGLDREMEVFEGEEAAATPVEGVEFGEAPDFNGGDWGRGRGGHGSILNPLRPGSTGTS